ncbi:putative GPI-anchored protein [Senna tora]|uniref:Putative GPI-anchored protein n=1 Tax=Senna tora TaxID=362788 RepID=A0A834TLM5_9FABA|nr:putative GPI-anchored protein [Senna tora]
MQEESSSKCTLDCRHIPKCSSFSDGKHFFSVTTKVDELSPGISPSVEPQPLLPVLAPSPLRPFTNNSVPNLSVMLKSEELGASVLSKWLCSLNFSAAEDIMSTTATDCWATFAPFLANVVCCPQFDAMLGTLIGQSSKYSGQLALNRTHASHCLSDIQKILVSQGANESLKNTCSVHPANLTEGSCPIIAVDEFESSVDTSRLLTACRKIDPVHECCDQVCQNAINSAARKIAINDMSNMDRDSRLPEQTARINDCKNIVLRWLAGKLDPATANSLFRGLSNCNLNKVCPLDFPNINNVVEECRNVIKNQTACCKTIKTYVSYLQNQSFITNLQALKCAALLGKKLQKANVSNNIYNLCQVGLKDFSLQESGCLLPSLPSDAVFDSTSGIGFICDLNDNIVAPWPSTSYAAASSCNRSMSNNLPHISLAFLYCSGWRIYKTSFSSYSNVCTKWSFSEEPGFTSPLHLFSSSQDALLILYFLSYFGVKGPHWSSSDIFAASETSRKKFYRIPEGDVIIQHVHIVTCYKRIGILI